MNKNEINFFSKKNLNLWFFFIPLLFIVIISAALLIVTGWYSIDYKIAQELAKGLTNEFGKYWSRFYDQAGNTELIITIITYLTILLETWFLIKISQKNKKFEKNYWIVNTYYIVVIFGWIIFHIVNLFMISNNDTGFGKGIDFVLIDNIKYQLTGASIAFIYQSMLLFLFLYYIRYKLVETNRIVKEQYWLKATKVFSFLIITYIVILILKGTTSKLYYYNAIFGDLFKNIPTNLKDHYLNSGFRYGYNTGNGFIENIPYNLQYPWWKPSLSLRSNPNMPIFNLPWKYAFPSGHIHATYGSGSLILLFLKNKNNKKINWKIKALFIMWLIHLLSMNFALIVERFHWMSDLVFTFIFSTLMIYPINFIVNKIFIKKIK